MLTIILALINNLFLAAPSFTGEGREFFMMAVIVAVSVMSAVMLSFWKPAGLTAETLLNAAATVSLGAIAVWMSRGDAYVIALYMQSVCISAVCAIFGARNARVDAVDKKFRAAGSAAARLRLLQERKRAGRFICGQPRRAEVPTYCLVKRK